MAKPGEGNEIRQLACDQVRPEAEPGTLRYEVWQERGDPTRFVHLFVFRDLEADRIHSESHEVKKSASVLYPECLAPVEFIDYEQIASNR